MSENTLRADLESAMTEEEPVPEESFEDFAARAVANGTPLEAINLMRLIDTEFPFFQDERNLSWAARAIQRAADNGSTFLGDGSDARSVLRTLQSIGEEADQKQAAQKAERERLDRAITGLGDVLTRTEALVASRRKH